MRKFNLASTPSNPEEGDPETTIDAAEARPPGGGGKGRRVLVIAGALVVVAGGAYLTLAQFTQFMAPKPAQPARPIRPIAKAPAPAPGVPPAGPPAPAKAGPAAQPPAQTAEPVKPAPPSTPVPVAGPAAPGPPPKAEVKVPAPTKGEPSQIAKAAPGEVSVAPAAPPARPARAEPAPAGGAFSLQVGAMINEGNAQKLKEQLEQLGYAPVVRKGTAHLRRHVVTTGDYGDRPGADEAVKRLAGQGIAARVTAVGGRFVVEAGSFASEDDAIDLARQLQRLNFAPRIQDQAQNATVYQVRVGSFPSRVEAQAKGAELKGKGFPYLVVKD